MARENEKYEVPQILYDVDDQGNPVSQIPYIEIQENKKMPPVLFIFEYKHTGETEPGPKGESVSIVDQIPHKYVDLELLKEKLPPELNDAVRVAIGMEPLKKAQEKGKQILDKVNKNIESLKEKSKGK